MSTADLLTRKARSYASDAQKFAAMTPDDLEPGGLTPQQWEIVYRAVASELHKVAGEVGQAERLSARWSA